MCNSLYVRSFGNIILCLCVNLSLKLQQAGYNNLKEHSIMLRHFIRGPLKVEVCSWCRCGACEAALSLGYLPESLFPRLRLMTLRNGSGCAYSEAYLIFGLVTEFAKKKGGQKVPGVTPRSLMWNSPVGRLARTCLHRDPIAAPRSWGRNRSLALFQCPTSRESRMHLVLFLPQWKDSVHESAQPAHETC